ncbi:hypothetical protein CEXT_523371 [Caerostris extrusa]|uniref:Uncharacterized protein n=1 Tax=Caerostris extrusa TaxID=172846 RepID=A0AAV4Y905_CAEEX|nr:hypothetical protein CEXT_523371 [Caerostris extrusa]
MSRFYRCTIRPRNRPLSDGIVSYLGIDSSGMRTISFRKSGHAGFSRKSNLAGFLGKSSRQSSNGFWYMYLFPGKSGHGGFSRNRIV